MWVRLNIALAHDNDDPCHRETIRGGLDPSPHEAYVCGGCFRLRPFDARHSVGSSSESCHAQQHLTFEAICATLQ